VIESRRVVHSIKKEAFTCDYEDKLLSAENAVNFSRTRRSTKLSHSPKWNTHSGVRSRCATYFAYFRADGKEIESVSELR
jgi:hypothetical protein